MTSDEVDSSAAGWSRTGGTYHSSGESRVTTAQPSDDSRELVGDEGNLDDLLIPPSGEWRSR